MSAPSTSKKRFLTLKEKLKVIEVNKKEKLTVRQLAERFSVGKTQICTILKTSEDITKEWELNANKNAKKKVGSFPTKQIDEAVFRWFCRVRTTNLPITGPIIQTKAREVAGLCKMTNFQASNGWLQRFKERHNIVYRDISGEGANVDPLITDDWKSRLPSIIGKYTQDCIYNLDETALFFKATPNKTLALKGETCHGGKGSKERVTLLLCVSMSGDKIKPLVIAKAKKPRCFKGLKLENLPVEWASNRKAWMTRDIMTQFLNNLNRDFRKKT